ncbi:hypothetical protein DEU56DRAFT_844248 [Suillus clintonianus]|uniref:uncharacterized protein n=1 Tax=Suillus clintonianus TaxID=1904413 RepID=UPI001B87ACE8|nr:uncharacterized protein DEU56DRAFT_844248 [Suillus clintonianus]KAG2110134.1 hypothetical protein DEU56DRAFT_844248 [Suillus clintonianus]
MGMDLPDEVIYNPVIAELADCIAELMLIDNDMISYNREQARGDENYDLITTVMLELGLDRSGLSTVLRRCLHGMATWARANHCWSYETQRYFGAMGSEDTLVLSHYCQRSTTKLHLRPQQSMSR